MLARKRLSSEIEAMKKDASKVMENLSNLSSHIGDVTKSEVGDLTGDAFQKISTEIAGYRDALDDIKQNIQRTLKSVDKSVKNNPYPFIVGSVGLGYVMGKLLRPASDSKLF